MGGLALALVGLYAGTFAVLVIARLAYPFELEFIEGGMLVQAWRMAHGLPVWLPPNAEFVPHAYTPLYPILSAVFVQWIGPAFWPLRLMSVIATVVSATTIGLAARRQAGALLGLLCAGLYLAGYDVVGGWYDLARVDSLFIALALGGMALAVASGPASAPVAGSARRHATSLRVLAAFLLALAFFTKQTALGFGVAVGLWMFAASGWRAGMLYSVVYAALLAAGIAVLNLSSDGSFGAVVFYLATSEPIEGPRLVSFFTRELVGRMLPLVLLLLYAVWQSRRATSVVGWLRANPWLMFSAVALLLSALQRARPGGALNSLMPLYALLCLAPALAWSGGHPVAGSPVHLRRNRVGPGYARGSVVLILIVGQLLLDRYDPRQHYPTPAMRAAGERLVARVAAAAGPVWVVDQPSFNLLAGQAPAVQLGALYPARRRGIDPFPADLVDAVTHKKFAFILTTDAWFDQEPAFLELLQGHYVKAETLPPSEAPATLNGMPVRSYHFRF